MSLDTASDTLLDVRDSELQSILTRVSGLRQSLVANEQAPSLARADRITAALNDLDREYVNWFAQASRGGTAALLRTIFGEQAVTASTVR